MYDAPLFQVDICPEELGNNVPGYVMLHGHLKAILKQVFSAIHCCSSNSRQWWHIEPMSMSAKLLVLADSCIQLCKQFYYAFL